MLLVIRVAISKKDRNSDHQLDRWELYRMFDSATDTADSGTSRYFMGLSSYYDEMFMNCHETSDNSFKTRTLVGLYPPSSSNSISSFIKSQIEFSAGVAYPLAGVKEFDSEAEMIAYAGSSSYEKNDANPGLCFGISITQSDTSTSAATYVVKLMFDDTFSDRSNLPNQEDPVINIL